MTNPKTQQKGFKVLVVDSFQHLGGLHVPSKDERHDCSGAIGQLTGRYADLWRRANTILTVKIVRNRYARADA